MQGAAMLAAYILMSNVPPASLATLIATDGAGVAAIPSLIGFLGADNSEVEQEEACVVLRLFANAGLAKEIVAAPAASRA